MSQQRNDGSKVVSVRVAKRDLPTLRKLRRIVRQRQSNERSMAMPSAVSLSFAVKVAVAEYVERHG